MQKYETSPRRIYYLIKFFEHNMHYKHCKIISLNNTCDNYWVLNHYKRYLEQ